MVDAFACFIRVGWTEWHVWIFQRTVVIPKSKVHYFETKVSESFVEYNVDVLDFTNYQIHHKYVETCCESKLFVQFGCVLCLGNEGEFDAFGLISF